ncbi:UDP-2,4-diacetamido-2,4,6-trideoxy-beta-L-altropyranose hydrolase [Vibrio sp. ZSDE26]|uniref:UDP-2,4-diacetamido-2,4, 6-trideoxy-beta-L-altropyranose hydrolase n=1 Tax=Vibrio amylolyticus TaxID=2847292 RepID=A0A9X2BGU8_9VIBR|nr:UDP-2,4-diacetamido-2,4,6-trideoxy-beta-L-altropyranose hydrolase [Vibrio amylolyticus]MCK6263256.1 UDP-2,4-diacetamido-2,4,6-trideoxy-beta-L-altropyranose hydrolase [Vibrio amylolyticus]
MNVVFRVDAAPQLGGGHLSRCLTFASALKNKGARCLFVLRDHSGTLGEYVTRAGFELILLPRTPGYEVDADCYSTWIGSPWDIDSEQTYKAINDIIPSGIDWVIVDHYGLDEKWERYFYTKGIKVGVIDDLVNRPHISDFLLDQTCGRGKYEYQELVQPDTVLYVGEQYCLLRKEFFEARNRAIEKRMSFRKTQKLLVSFGSTDPKGHTLLALEGLSYFATSRDVEVVILIGSACPHLDKIEHLAELLNYKVTIHVDCDRVAELIVDSDLAIGAAGSSTWERCFLGLPTLLVKTADNQTDVVNKVISSGASVGYFQPLEDEQALGSALIELETRYVEVSGLALSLNIGNNVEVVTSTLLGE